MGLTPSTIYTPQPVAIVNPNFDENIGATPPVGWTPGGIGLNTNYALSYDTTSQYEGAASLVINAFEAEAGISQNLGPVTPGQAYQLGAALRAESTNAAAMAQIFFLDKNGNLVPGLTDVGINYFPSLTISANTTTDFVYETIQGTVPAGAVSMIVQVSVSSAGGGTCEFGAIGVTLLSNAIPYYLSLITSEWQNSPNYLQLVACLLQPFVDTAICAASLNSFFDIANAVGAQLDVLGVILGASRTLPFTPLGVEAATTEAISSTGVHAVTTNNTTYMDTITPLTIDSGGNEETVTPTLITQGVGFTASFTKTHLTDVPVVGPNPSAILSDASYRLVLQAKVLFNQFNGQYQGANSILWAAWQTLFPGGRIYITDNQNMTATIFCVGAFSGLIQQMITNGLIVPRCQAVEFTYEFATLPIFGFGGINPAFVNGFGIGNWASP